MDMKPHNLSQQKQTPDNIFMAGSANGSTQKPTAGQTTAEPEKKMPKGIKTQKAMQKNLAQKLNIDSKEVDAGKADHNTLQNVEKDKKIQEEAEQDVWYEKIKQQRDIIVKRMEQMDKEIDMMIEEQPDIKLTKDDESIEYVDTIVLKERIKKKRFNPDEQEKKEVSTVMMIRKGAWWRRAWDVFIITIAIYSTFTIPVNLAFSPPPFDRKRASSPWFYYIDWFTTAAYVADIIVQFRTTVIDNLGEEIFNGRKIAILYVKSITFWIDLFALGANPLTDGIPLVQFVGILKINRVLRIKKIITQANLEKSLKAGLKIVYFTFFLYIYIHLTACIWFYIVKNGGGTWIPPYDFIDYTESTLFNEDTEIFTQYWVCIYYCTLVLGGNELGPSQVTELFYIVVINLLGAIVNAQIFGELAVLLSQLGGKDASFQRVVDTVNTAMTNMNLPSEVRQDIRDYFQRIQSTQAQQTELQQFLDQISPSLKVRVQGQIFESELGKKNVVLKMTAEMIRSQAQNTNQINKRANRGLQVGVMHQGSAEKRANDLIRSLVEKLGTQLTLPEDEIIKQDEIPEVCEMYIIGKGDCDIHIRDQRGKEWRKFRKLKEGDHFGEIAMLYNCRRSATVESGNYNTLAKIMKHRFRELLSEYPEYEVCLKKHIREEYLDPKTKFLFEMIRNVEYFKNQPDEILFEVMFTLQPRRVEQDQVVLANSENANAVIFIEDGIISLSTTFEGNDFEIERLARGSVINHNAFFMQDQMYVDVKAATDVKILELTIAKMNEIRQKYDGSHFDLKILTHSSNILKQDKKFPLDYIMRLAIAYKLDDEQVRRENRLKNVVMRIIINIRERKKRPKLSDFLKAYRKKKDDPKASKDVKQEFQKKFKMLYSGEDVDEKGDDVKFDKLMSNFDRIQKQLSQQQQALSHLVKKVNNLIERREKREKRIRGESVDEIPVREEFKAPVLDIKPYTEDQTPSSKKNNFLRGNAKKSTRRGNEDSSDEPTGEDLQKKKDQEREELELLYRNTNSDGETENVKQMTKMAGAFEKANRAKKFEVFRSDLLQEREGEGGLSQSFDSAGDESGEDSEAFTERNLRQENSP